jgi:DNA-binding NtrC family response regulator
MPDLVFVSTHRLPVAGQLREALVAASFEVRLVPSADLARADVTSGPSPALFILTGVEALDDWIDLARDHVGVPVLGVLPDPTVSGRRDWPGQHGLEPDATFFDETPPRVIAAAARAVVDHRKLQRITGIVGDSPAIREVLTKMVQIAPVDSTVLITGESGTGKELVARGLHALSLRRGQPFLAVNVAALSDTLLESELFGHEKGAFTGATDTRKGFFELADRGTLFLDEIGEMPLSTQTQFLRVLEQREFLRVGGQRAISVDVRVVAATNRDLREAVAEGRFRQDLYYRLNILSLQLPPLRDRVADLPLLIQRFVRDVVERTGRLFPGITPEAMARLEAHPWPGNIRELRNLVEGLVVLSPGRPITPSDLPRELGYPLLPGPRPLLPSPRIVDEAPPSPRSSSSSASAPSPASSSARAPDPPSIRPELEFIFRTLVDLRVDMEELRRDFEHYRRQVESERRSPARPLVEGPGGWELGTRDPRAPLPEAESEDALEVEPDAEWPRLNRVLPPTPITPEAEGGRLEIPEDMTMDAIEEAAIRAALKRADGNRRLAAERLGIGERTLYRKIQKYGLD